MTDHRNERLTWGINRYHEPPEFGGRLVIEIVIAGWYFPFRVWGTRRKG